MLPPMTWANRFTVTRHAEVDDFERIDFAEKFAIRLPYHIAISRSLRRAILRCAGVNELSRVITTRTSRLALRDKPAQNQQACCREPSVNFARLADICDDLIAS